MPLFANEVGDKYCLLHYKMYSDAFWATLFDRFQIRYEPLNLSRLQYMIDTGRLDASKPIKMDSLHSSGAVGKIEHGVKLLGDVSA